MIQKILQTTVALAITVAVLFLIDTHPNNFVTISDSFRVNILTIGMFILMMVSTRILANLYFNRLAVRCVGQLPLLGIIAYFGTLIAHQSWFEAYPQIVAYGLYFACLFCNMWFVARDEIASAQNSGDQLIVKLLDANKEISDDEIYRCNEVLRALLKECGTEVIKVKATISINMISYAFVCVTPLSELQIKHLQGRLTPECRLNQSSSNENIVYINMPCKTSVAKPQKIQENEEVRD